MKKVFLDTNFLMDLLERAEYKMICSQIIMTGSRKNIKFYVSFLSVANFAYLNRKKEKNVLYQALRYIFDIFRVLPNTVKDLEEAIALESKDYEDALQYATAISAGCDCIITRNGKDFPFATIPVYSPNEFLETLLT